MRLVWHVFRKDLRRFRWYMLVPLAMLAFTAHLDSDRTGASPGALEGWLHLLVPLSWSFLIASLVREDSPVAESSEWKTLPMRWQQLLAAKLLFAIAAIHVPLFVSQFYVLDARELDPAGNLASLLQNQFDWFVLLTLPSAALASLTGSMAQFLACAMPVTALLASLSKGLPWWIPTPRIDLMAPAAVIFVGSAVILVWQYRRLLLPVGRAAGACTVAMALVVEGWLPRRATAKLQTALSPAQAEPVSITAGPPVSFDKHPLGLYGNAGIVTAIPVHVSGWPKMETVETPVSLELITASGERIAAEWPRWMHGSRQLEFTGYLRLDGNAPEWQVLQMSAPLYQRLRGQKLKVRAAVLLSLRRYLPPVDLAREGWTRVPASGRCTSAVLPEMLSRAMLRTSCESGAPMPVGGRVRLIDRGTERRWTGGLGDSRTAMPAPQGTWLSPVRRSDAFFHLMDGEVIGPSDKWMVPKRALPDATIQVASMVSAGAMLVDYEFDGISLDDYTVPNPTLPQ